MALQEVLTRFGFDFDGNRLNAVERGVKRASRNLDTIAHNADAFQQRMGGFLQRAKGLIATYLGFRAVRSITTDYAQGADAVAKFSAALSLNTETYQGLQHAVQLGGSDTENLNKALGQLSKRALEANQGLKTNMRAFREAGVEWKDAQGNLKGADQLFLELADGLNNLDDENKATGLSMQLLGRTGLKLRNTMQGGSKAIREQIKEAKLLGKVLSKEQLKAAENFNDEMLRAKSVLQGVRNQIAAKLLPAITRQLKAFQEWARRGDNLKVAMHRLKVAALIAAGALSMVVAAKTHKAFVNFFSAIKHGIKALRALGTAAFWAQAKLLLIPAAITLIYLAIEDLVFFAQGKDSLIGRILGDSKLADSLRKSLIAIGVAAVAAWKDLKPALLDAWKALKPALTELWTVIRPLIGPAFKAAIFLMAGAFRALAFWIRIASSAIKFLVKGISFAANQLRDKAAVVKGAWKDALGTMKTGLSRFGSAVNEQTKKIGIDFNKMQKSAGRGFSRFIAGHDAFWRKVDNIAHKALRLMGLLKPKVDLGERLGRVLRKTGTIEGIGTTSTGAPILSGLQRPLGSDTIFGASPVGPLPGAGIPGLGAALAQTTVNTQVSAGAIPITIIAQGDPGQIAAKVDEVVTAKIKSVFTDASRDLVKPPPGQS
jgi:hypothetical protein